MPDTYHSPLTIPHKASSSSHGKIFVFCYYVKVIISITLLLTANIAAASTEREYQVKAAFVLNFLKFTTFPNDEAITAFQICLPEQNEVFKFFSAIADRSVRGRPVVVRSVSLDNLQDCHAVFFPAAKVGVDASTQEISTAILTIGETRSFLRRGGIIQFYLEQGKTRFKINRKRAEARGIRFSSKLLRIADLVGE